MPFHACTYCSYVATTSRALNAHLDRFIPELGRLHSGKARQHPPHPIPILREGRYRNMAGVTWSRSRKRTEREVLAATGVYMETLLASESEKEGWQKRMCSALDDDWWMGKVEEAMALYLNWRNRDLLVTFVGSVVDESRELYDNKGSDFESDSPSEQEARSRRGGAKEVKRGTIAKDSPSSIAPMMKISDPFIDNYTTYNRSINNPNINGYHSKDGHHNKDDHHNKDGHHNKDDRAKIGNRHKRDIHVNNFVNRGSKNKRQDTSSDSDSATLDPRHRRKRGRSTVSLEESEEDPPIHTRRRFPTLKAQKGVSGTRTRIYQQKESDSFSGTDIKDSGADDAPMHVKKSGNSILFMLTVKLLTVPDTAITVPIDSDTTLSSVIEAAWQKGPKAIRKLACKKVLVGTGKWQGVWDEVTWGRIKRSAKRQPNEWACAVGFGE